MTQPANGVPTWLDGIPPAQRLTVFRILARAAELGRAASAQEAIGQEEAAPASQAGGAAYYESEVTHENGTGRHLHSV